MPRRLQEPLSILKDLLPNIKFVLLNCCVWGNTFGPRKRVYDNKVEKSGNFEN
jgi:hypothetical protein